MSILRQIFTGGSGFRVARGGFTLLDQPARHHGASIFFQPLIQQGGNFLADVGGVAEAGEFVALQGIA